MFNPKKSFSKFLNTKKLHAVAISENEPTGILFCIRDKQYDITNSHALISLKPFAIAVNAESIIFSNPEQAILRIIANEKVFGELKLKLVSVKTFDNLTLCIYEAGLSSHPISLTASIWNSLLLQLKNRTDRKSKNFVVPPAELLKLFVYSLKPRPVFLVSVLHEQGFDAFPVDIAGMISANKVLISIRSTSAAITPILATKKICASAVSYNERNKVYKLGRHHAGGILPQEANELNFVLSAQLKIPVPAAALHVQEMILENNFTTGAHTQFIFRVVNSYPLISGMQLAHTPWFNRNYFKNRFDLPK